MSEQLDETLRRMEKAAEKILHDILNGTETRYETEDDSDIYTIKDKGETNE
jgi:hypothetical protein